MHKYYHTFPQVAGELGPKTQFSSRNPLRVSYVEYLFNIWPCDAILEAYPCFIVRSDLRSVITNNGLSGAVFSDCAVGFTDYVENSHVIELPDFHRLEPIGVLGVDDIILGPTQKLIVSERARLNFYFLAIRL